MKFTVVIFTLILQSSLSTTSAVEKVDTIEKHNQTSTNSSSELNSITQIGKNDSKIVYISSEFTKNAKKFEKNKENSEELIIDKNVTLADLLNAIGLRNKKTQQKQDKNNKNHSQTNKISTKSNFNIDDQHVENTTNTEHNKKSEDSREEFILRRIGETENDSLHKNQEFVIDKITYSTKNESKEENLSKVTEDKTINYEGQRSGKPDHKHNLELAKELKKLFTEIQKIKKENSIEEDENLVATKNNQDVLQQINEPQQQSMVNSIPSGNVVSPCKKAQSSVNYGRTGGPVLRTNLPDNLWTALQARQDMLLRIAREQNLNRIRYITDLVNNIMSRLVYRPLYGKK